MGEKNYIDKADQGGRKLNKKNIKRGNGREVIRWDVLQREKKRN